MLDAVASKHPALMQFVVNEHSSLKAVVQAIDKMLVTLAEEDTYRSGHMCVSMWTLAVIVVAS